MEWWYDFWGWAQSPLGATVVGGLILAFILYVISRVRRVSLFDGFVHILEGFLYIGEWLWDHRLRSNSKVIEAQHETWRVRNQAKSDAVDAQLKATRLLDAATTRGNTFADKYIDAERARRDAEDVLHDRTMQVRKWKHDADEARAAAVDAERRLGIAVTAIVDAEAEKTRLETEVETLTADLAKKVDAPSSPNLPLPRPRWSVYLDEERDLYKLRNSVERSVANEVRLEVPGGGFTFSDGAHWSSIWGNQERSFDGMPTGNSSTNGVYFEVTWFDENDRPQSEYTKLDPWEKAPENTSMSV
jgi:hypothetical protein